MELLKVLKGIDYKLVSGIIDCSFNHIQYNSKSISKGDMFICINGLQFDGHNYIDDAIKKGAKIIVCEKEINKISKDVTFLIVKDTRKAMSIIASNYYDNPSKKLKIIGITGTNGKTTTSYYVKSILDNNKIKTGLIGTISNFIGDKEYKTERTTPESLDLQKLFYDMVNEKCTYCIMEVSSHSIALDRIYGIDFHIGLITNITLDHLDFHGTMENYFNTKMKIFQKANICIVNSDCSYSDKIYNHLNTINKNFITFGIKNKANLKVEEKNINYNKNNYILEGCKFKYNIPGEHNIYNSLGAILICKSLGLNLQNISIALDVKRIPGRFERLKEEIEIPFEVIIDFAHTPDGLFNVLKTARKISKKKLISVYGCGGDKNKDKRAELGRVGTEMSDYVIITSDNPRDENPNIIINDIIDGIQKQNYSIIENRFEAIKKAIEIAEQGDVIVLAGKGHEKIQITNNGVIPFDEKTIIKNLIQK